jgi:predicted DNA-binding protein (MmcQ/YjbR family)
MYHMSKAHWNSIILCSGLSDDEMKKMIDHSYELIFKSLTKKLKTELGLM